MDAVFKKMNFKTQEEVLVLNAPDSFQENIKAMLGLTTFYHQLDELEKVSYAIVFVTQKEEINQLAPLIVKKMDGDALIWFCYPKKSSKKYVCNFNRDTGWQIMGDLQLEPVKIVAIDKDWSALRFRNVKYIKKITRRASMALSEEAKKRTTGKK